MRTRKMDPTLDIYVQYFLSSRNISLPSRYWSFFRSSHLQGFLYRINILIKLQNSQESGVCYSTVAGTGLQFFEKSVSLLGFFCQCCNFFQSNIFSKDLLQWLCPFFFSHIFSWYCMKFYVLFHRFLGQVKRLKLFFFLVVLKGLT